MPRGTPAAAGTEDSASGQAAAPPPVSPIRTLLKNREARNSARMVSLGGAAAGSNINNNDRAGIVMNPGSRAPELLQSAGGAPDGLREIASSEGPAWVLEVDWTDPEYSDLEAAFDPSALVPLARDPRLANLQLNSTVFLDTETTSLSGGAGVLVFLVGMLQLHDGGRATLKQFFMKSPAGERAMLAAVAAELSKYKSVITFFGKSFDRHRLEDKYKIHGLVSNFPADVHADLYHMTRARFGWKLADARLRTVESSLLGIHRADDLPGSEAPRAWFDYLAGRPTLLKKVFDHNADDVRSLVILLKRCCAPLDGGADPREALAAAKGAHALGDDSLTLQFAEIARRSGDAFAAATRLCAEVHKKRGGAAAAAPFWEELSQRGCCESTLRLAKYYITETGESGGGRERALAALEMAERQAFALPAGAVRDRARAEQSALRTRIGR